MASRLISLQEARYFPTIHHWKTYVHQNDVRAFRMRQQMPLFAIVRSDDAISLPFESSGEHIHVHFIVFDQQNFWHYSPPPDIASSIVQWTGFPPSIKLFDRCRRLTIISRCCPFPATTLLFGRSVAKGDGECLGCLLCPF